mmetsp:Transcript_123371/g.360225  ORF Transcript_123371/g.360225 Transcript_123371/m.360225 type:complete len:982 (-) Transcript_123371:106-3051(-)
MFCWWCQNQADQSKEAESLQTFPDPGLVEHAKGITFDETGPATSSGKSKTSLSRQRELEAQRVKVARRRHKTTCLQGFPVKYAREGGMGELVEAKLTMVGEPNILFIVSGTEELARYPMASVRTMCSSEDDRGLFDDAVIASLDSAGRKRDLLLAMTFSKSTGTPSDKLVILVDRPEHREALAELVKVTSLDAISRPITFGQSGSTRFSVDSTNNARFLKHYLLTEEKLGEGAAAVVFSCTQKDTKEEFAVKMVDKVETPLEAIKKEAEIMGRLSHPNIVRSYGVFFERCFVCIVMDKCDHGDFVMAVQHQVKVSKKVECHHVAPLAKQMLSAMMYLHEENIVHRDIKGDNFLMSTRDISSPDCQLFLTDFGLATELQASGRLTDQVGSKNFWSPEHFAKDYGQKIDVWALGIIIYGAISGRFPFKDSHGIRFKEVKCPKRCTPDAEDFICKLLRKEEKKRPSAADMIGHRWFASFSCHYSSEASRPPTYLSEGTISMDGTHLSLKSSHTEFRQADVHHGIKERRRELLGRLTTELSESANARSSFVCLHTSEYLQKKFQITRDGLSHQFEWRGGAEMKAKLLADLEQRAKSMTDHADEAEEQSAVECVLKEHRVDLSLFGHGQAKSLRDLTREVSRGKCRLMQDAQEHRKLVRVVDVAALMLVAVVGSEKRLLLETADVTPDRHRVSRTCLPGHKKHSWENTRATAGRILEDVGLSEDMVTLDFSFLSRYEEEAESASYPGFRTVYRKEVIEATVKDPAAASKAGLPAFSAFTRSAAEHSRDFVWATEEQAVEDGIQIQGRGSQAASSLVRPPVGLDPEGLDIELTELGIAPSKFGSGDAISVQDFAEELMRGETTLARGPQNEALRIVNSVVLILENKASGELLVQTGRELPGGDQVNTTHFPRSECRPNEDPFLSAKRILRRQLDMDDNAVKLHHEVRLAEEENPNSAERQRELRRYPGLRTLYRRRLIKGELLLPGA